MLGGQRQGGTAVVSNDRAAENQSMVMLAGEACLFARRRPNPDRGLNGVGLQKECK